MRIMKATKTTQKLATCNLVKMFVMKLFDLDM